MIGNIWSTDNFTTLLTRIGFSPLLPLSKEQIKLIDSPPIEILKETATLAEAEIKLNYILVNLHGCFKINTNLSQLYYSYKQLVSFLYYKNPLSLVSFLNQLVLFDLVLRHFNTDFLCIDLNEVYEEKIVVFLLEELTELPSIISMKQQLTELTPNDILHKYLFLFFICTMCNKMDIGSYTFESFKHNISLYNQFYISNFTISIMIHIQMLIYVKLFIKEMGKTSKRNKRGSISIETNTIKTSSKRALSTAKDSKTTQKNSDIIPYTFYTFFEEEISNIPCIQFYTCQNILKMYLNANIPQLPYQFHVNLIVVSVDYFIQKKLICEFFHPVSTLKIKSSSKNQYLISKTSFAFIYKNYTIRHIIISIDQIDSVQLVKDILMQYEALIIKSSSFTLQEPINNQIDQCNQPIDVLTLHSSILQFFLYQTILIKKKKSLLNFSFILASFKLTISKNFLSKEAQLFFKYSHISERTLLNYFSIHENLTHLINDIISVITSFEEYKTYMIGIRISQTNFQSNQLTFFFSIITQTIVNYIENKGLRNMVVYEKSFANYSSGLQVYIKDPNDRKSSDRVAKLKLAVKKMEHTKFSFLNQFLMTLVELFDIIVMSKEKSNLFKLIRTYDSNMIFFLLRTVKSKEKEIVNVDQNNENIEIISYFANNKEIYDNGLKMFIKMREIVSLDIPFRITLIMDRYYLDNTILTDPKFKRYAKTLYENIEDFYLMGRQNIVNDTVISKHKSGFKINISNNNAIKDNHTANPNMNTNVNANSNDLLNYDLFIIDQCISVVNYKRYDAVNDCNYTCFIYDFISLLSDCIEFAIYVLKNKDIFTPRFIYLFRITTDDYFYAFNHKNNQMFIKRLENFESLITLSLKKAQPLFCLLSKKQTSSYTEANNNFFDVFLRLFLNLHKVLDKNESFNQVFFQKIHKNIFDCYYSTFTPIAFEYKAFTIFNDFFLSNDYFTINNKQKFKHCYLIPFDSFPKTNKNILRNTMSENVVVYDFHIPPNYWKSNKDLCYFTFHKIEKIIEGISKIQKTKTILTNNEKAILKMYLLKKVPSEQIAALILEMYCDKSELNVNIFEELLLHFHSTKKRIIKQKADLKTIHTKGMRSEDNKIEDGTTIDMNQLENCVIY